MRFSDGSDAIARAGNGASLRQVSGADRDADSDAMIQQNSSNRNHHLNTSPSHELENLLQTHPQHVYDGLDLDLDSGEMTKDDAEQFYSIVLPMADRNLFSAMKQEKWYSEPCRCP